MRSGIFIRAERDGQYQSIDFCELSDEEMDKFAESQSIDTGFNWAIALARWVTNNVGPLPPPTEEETTGPYGMFFDLVTHPELIKLASKNHPDRRGWELACLIGGFIRDAVIDNDPSQPPPVNEPLITKDAPTYQLVVLGDGTPGFKCKNCGAISYNVNDYKMCYCGNCHMFHQ